MEIVGVFKLDTLSGRDDYLLDRVIFRIHQDPRNFVIFEESYLRTFLGNLVRKNKINKLKDNLDKIGRSAPF
jgi:hypothetical protein